MPVLQSLRQEEECHKVKLSLVSTVSLSLRSAWFMEKEFFNRTDFHHILNYLILPRGHVFIDFLQFAIVWTQKFERFGY